MIQYGDLSIERVLEFDGPGLDPYFLLPELTPGVLAEHKHWLEPYLMDPASGKLMSSFHSFVIRSPRRGNDWPTRPPPARMISAPLSAATSPTSTGRNSPVASSMTYVAVVTSSPFASCSAPRYAPHLGQ